MPKIKNNLSLLTSKKNFLDAKQVSNPDELERYLITLMEVANKHYQTAHLQSKNNLDTKEFSSCKEKFREIMSIIEKKGNPTQLTNELYFEAWTSMLYSDVYTLNLDPETEEKLNGLNKKILAIEIDFNQLVIKKISLESNDKNKNSLKQLKHIDNFQQFWIVSQNSLKAEYCYNFAEFLIKKSSFEKSIYYFKKSASFYREAAKKSIHAQHKMKLLNFANQTNKRIQFIQERSNQNQCNVLTPPLKKLVIHLKKLPDALSPRWKIINNPSLLFPSKTKSFPKTTNLVKNSTPSHPIKRKRTLFTNLTSSDELSYQKTKKLKKMSPICQLRSLWIIECEKIVDKFKQLSIEIDLVHLSNNKKSFNERKAIVHNNYAIFLVEDLNNIEKKYSDAQKITSLKKAAQLLEKSIEFYKKTHLSEKKEALEQCITTLKSSLIKLETTINQMATSKDSSSIKAQKCRTKSTMTLSDEKLFDYQGIYSTRLACKFFKDSFTDTPINNQNLRKVYLRPKLAQVSKIL